ncbi:zeta toxin family protein [Pseudomonas sp. NPDC087342]|uniref:zeta toxin family protein n=1 Tax=Pseudomonas sp. NPDC087342 TaxID=3364437 RepID=UPI003819A841
MSQAPTYTYTAEQLTTAYTEIIATLFTNITAGTIPKMLIVAGLQGSGKTWLLEKKLLPSNSYTNYVRLYLPDYRKKHPQYADMIKLGVLHAYENTEAFVRELSTRIFVEAFTRKYNIIMECAFDSIDFATFPPSATALGYQFETHIVGCNQEFAHLSSIKRALRSLEKQELERFVNLDALQTSMSNAQAIILAFETAAKAVNGAQIYLYERGLGALKERTLRAHSTYTIAADGSLAVTAVTAPYAYSAYSKIINNHVFSMADRDEMVKECHLALLKTGTYAEHVPDFVYNDLYAYIVKYVYR